MSKITYSGTNLNSWKFSVCFITGKSLDAIMKLREMKKLGIVGKKKKKRGKGKNRKKKNGAGNSNMTKLKKPKDVFEFINTHLGAKKSKFSYRTLYLKCRVSSCQYYLIICMTHEILYMYSSSSLVFAEWIIQRKPMLYYYYLFFPNVIAISICRC